jgi:hypothetical protein
MPLHIRDLASKAERVIPDVSQFTLSKDGQLLVYIVASRKDDTNGVYALNPRSGGPADAIKVGPGKYSNLTWDEKQTKLAFLYDSSAVPKLPAAPLPRLAGTSTTAPAAPAAPPAPPQWRAFVWNRHAMQASSVLSKLSMDASGGFFRILPIAQAIHAPTTSTPDEVLGPGTPGQRNGWSLSSGSLNFSADGGMLYVNTARVLQPGRRLPPRARTTSSSISGTGRTPGFNPCRSCRPRPTRPRRMWAWCISTANSSASSPMKP